MREQGNARNVWNKLPVTTEKESRGKKKSSGSCWQKQPRGTTMKKTTGKGISFRRKNTADTWKKTEVSVTCPVARKVYWRPFARLACITERHHWRKGIPWESGERKETVLKAIIKYGRMEIEREDKGICRFHKSLFYLPKTSVSMCFALYPDFMDAQEHPEKPGSPCDRSHGSTAAGYFSMLAAAPAQ